MSATRGYNVKKPTVNISDMHSHIQTKPSASDLHGLIYSTTLQVLNVKNVDLRLVPVAPGLKISTFTKELFLNYSINNPLKHNYFVFDWIVYRIILSLPGIEPYIVQPIA
jgi:hypothetical protein